MSNLAIYAGVALTSAGVPSNGADVEVRREDTGALAAIWSDEAGTTPITNPATAFTDSSGRFQFYAAGLVRGYSVKVTKGADTYTLHNQAIGTEQQIDQPINVPGIDGYERISLGSTELWLPPSARADKIRNGQIVESHSGNAVTYTLKGKGGVDLSAVNPCYLLFPSATLTSGDFDVVKLTANISVTVSSGSTLGHASAIPQHTFINALKTGSTAELFVSTLPPDYQSTFFGQRLITTTAEGGAGAADSPTGVYSTTARSSVQWIPVAKVKGTQTAAGTWAASPTQIDMAPFSIPLNAASVNRAGSNQSIASATETKVQYGTEDHDYDSVYDAVTNYRYQPNVAGLYRINHAGRFTSITSTNAMQVGFYKNGSVGRYSGGCANAGATAYGTLSDTAPMNGTTDYIEFYVFHSDGGGARNWDGAASFGYANAHRISPQ